MELPRDHTYDAEDLASRHPADEADDPAGREAGTHSTLALRAARQAPRRPRGAQRAVMTAEQYRALVQALVDRARSDHSIAELLAGEARQRFGAEIAMSADETDGGAAQTAKHTGGDR